ncbi:MAG: ribonuclease HII [Candidatus Hadarchaeaceae archaeon]
MIMGADEAGRGPVLGNMVLCGALFEHQDLEGLRAMGVKDSKQLSPGRREFLAKVIAEKARALEIVEIAPREIDVYRLVRKVNLNELEAQTFAGMINRLRPELVYLDSPDPNPGLFERRVRKYLTFFPRIVAENFADQKYVAVAAASIVAKVRRDRCLAGLRRRYGDLGSGYPADPVTIAFLKNWVRQHGSLPDFARRSWETARRIEEEWRRVRLG